MGWASGAGLFKKVAEAAVSAIPDDDTRKVFYSEVIAAFEDYDADTLEEVVEFDPNPDPVLVAALRESWET